MPVSMCYGDLAGHYGSAGRKDEEMNFTADTIVKALEERGLTAELWRTGGGCMTIFASAKLFTGDIRDAEQVAVLGPGTGDGFDPAVELYVGIDSFGINDEDPRVVPEESGLEAIIDAMVEAATCEPGEWL
jgi:hypothetical protein